MSRSWIESAKVCGLELLLAYPKGFDPPQAEIDAANATRAKVGIVRDPMEAASEAHVISTDVWASMGQEHEMERRKKAFEGFCGSRKMMAKATSNTIVLHDLPAHRGEEMEAEVIESAQSAVWMEAEARLHTAKAALNWAIAW
jgi:ornithine carbamoyltransferase